MAHIITGIDLGSWSVKFIALEVGFRHSRIVAQYEERLAQDDRPLSERQAEALRAGVAELPSGSTMYVALSGDMLTVRVLDLPFADARKIDQIVGYEMEGQMIHDLNDVILDHRVLSARGEVATGNEGCKALVVAARTEEVGALLATLQTCNLDPRSLYVAPLLYRAGEEEAVDRDEPPRCRVVVDIGHRRTNLCFLVGEEPVFARTLLRGGDELTRALVTASNGVWSHAQAEQAKAQVGFVASSGRLAVTTAERQVDPILREALQPLVRELHQTLNSFASKDRVPVAEILLAGGGARLGGLPGFLEDELGIAVRPLRVPVESKEGPDGLPLEAESAAPDEDRFVLADAIVQAAVRGEREIDFRRGPFQYRARYSVLRQRGGHLLLLAASLVVCSGIYATITLRRLSAEQRELRAQLETATKELFGEARMEATDVTAALRRSFRDEMAVLPKATAYDLLDEISRRIPPADDVQVDIEDLDIHAKKTLIKGTVDSAASVEEIVAKLKEIECFEDISKGPITEVSGGAKQFSLTIASKCP